jgi:hypothetical protein
MANTPIISHNVQIELDDELGAQVDVSGNANNVNITETLRVGTYQTFKEPWDQKIDGGRGWKGSIKIFYSRQAGEAFRKIFTSWRTLRGARTLTVSIPDATTGSDEWSGEAVIEGDIDLSLDRTSDDPVMVELPLGGHGALSRVTIV